MRWQVSSRSMRPLAVSLFALLLVISAPSAGLAQPSISATLDDNVPQGTYRQDGDTLDYTTVITNSGAGDGTGVTLTSPAPADTTLVPGSVTVTPIAFNDGPYSLTGNTPITISAASGVLANDIDPDSSTPASNVGVTAVSVNTAGTNGSVSMNANGGFTFTPQTGFKGTTTFTYRAHDAQGLDSNETGTVTMTVTEPIWYVDSAADAGDDGSFGNAFTTVGGAVAAAAANTNDPNGEVDDTIFVYNRGVSYSQAAGVALATGEQFLGDGSSLTSVNGNAIGASASNSAFSASGAVQATLTLGQDNTVSGININAIGAAAAAIADNGGTVGTLHLINVGAISSNSGIVLNAGGTVDATGTNTITANNGTALNITNTTIGASGLTFQSISSGGGTNGIVLNNTGSTAGLTVTGDGGATNNGSGGTVQNTTGAGISLTSTRDVSLDQVNLQNLGNDGINGSSVTNFNLTRSTIAGAGDGANEFGVFITNLLGTNSIDNSSITNSETQNLRVLNNVATPGTLTISNSVFTGTTVANGSDAINLISEGSANLTVNLTGNNDLNNTQGDGIQGSSAGTATLRLTVDGTDSDFNGNLGSAVNIAAANGSQIFTLIQDFGNRGLDNNPANNTGGLSTGTNGINGLNVINVQNLDTSTINATVQNNVINGLGNNASGIRVIQEGNGTITAELDNNFVNGMVSNGIVVQGRAGTGTTNVTIHDNDVVLTSVAALDGISIQSGSSAGGDDNIVRVDLFNNTSSSTPASQQGYRFATLDADGNMVLEDFAGVGTNATDIANWVNNPPKNNVGLVQVLIGIGDSFGTIADVPEPALPLLAAGGGVGAASGDVLEWQVAGKGGSNGASAPPPREMLESLSQTELDSIVEVAIARWSSLGLTPGQIERLRALRFEVTALGGLHLGEAAGEVIRVDSRAAGNGWFIDASPTDDAEFASHISGTRRTPIRPALRPAAWICSPQ